MSFAKTIEMSAESPEGFHDAVKRGCERAAATLDHVQSIWVKDEEIVMNDGKVEGFRAHLKVTFRLNDRT